MGSETTKHVLVVDDEDEIRHMLRLLLEASGYMVSEACNGQECIAMANANPPDAIILDVMMPKMNGGKVARTLKKNEATSLIPIIMLTGLDEKKYMKAALWELGVDFYVVKPADPEDILDKVEQAVKRPKFAE